MVFLSASKGVGTYCPVLSSFIPPGAGSPGRAPKLCLGVCAQSSPKAASTAGTAASTAPLLHGSKGAAWRSRSPWTTTDGDLPHRATSLSPSSVSLWCQVVPFLSCFAVPNREWEVKGGSEETAALWGRDVGSRTGPGKEGSVPEKRGDERVIVTHFNTLFKHLASSRFLPEQPHTPTSSSLVSHLLPAFPKGILLV